MLLRYSLMCIFHILVLVTVFVLQLMTAAVRLEAPLVAIQIFEGQFVHEVDRIANGVKFVIL